MTTIPARHRVPTGSLDRLLSVGLDSTVTPARLVLTEFRRSADAVSDSDFRPGHVITLESQYGALLLERIRAALDSGSAARPQGPQPQGAHHA